MLKRRKKQNPTIKEYGRALARGTRSVHVIPSESGWTVKRIGTPGQRFDTRADAVQGALRLARSDSSVYIHGKNGAIREKRAEGSIRD